MRGLHTYMVEQLRWALFADLGFFLILLRGVRDDCIAIERYLATVKHEERIACVSSILAQHEMESKKIAAWRFFFF